MAPTRPAPTLTLLGSGIGDENSAKNIPVIPGLGSFLGEVIHLSRYKLGKTYSGKNMTLQLMVATRPLLYIAW
jgi:hypothetical protein